MKDNHFEKIAHESKEIVGDVGKKTREEIEKAKEAGRNIGEKANETYKKAADKSIEIIEKSKH